MSNRRDFPSRRICARVQYRVSRLQTLSTVKLPLLILACREPGENVVARSVELGHPIIFVSPNYRLNGRLRMV